MRLDRPAIALVALALSTAAPAVAERPRELTVGLFAPSLGLSSATEELLYADSVAKAIQAATGLPTSGKNFLRKADLEAARVDVAILDAACVSALDRPILASVALAGETQLPWVLASRGARSVAELRGSVLAFVRTDCRDRQFVENVLLRGEVPADFFARFEGKETLRGAAALVADYRGADALFVPRAARPASLNPVYEAGVVPTPAVVQMSRGLGPELAAGIARALFAHRFAGKPLSFAAPNPGAYRQLGLAMRGQSKTPLFMAPGRLPLPLRGNIVLAAPPFETLDADASFELSTLRD